MSILARIGAAICVASLSLGAHAMSYVIGPGLGNQDPGADFIDIAPNDTFDPNVAGKTFGQGNFEVSTPGAFTDNIFFQLASDALVSVSFVDNPTSFDGDVFLKINNQLIAIGTDSGSTLLSNIALGMGTHEIEVTGIAAGIFGGSYDIAVNAAVVPLPAAAWMFISALAGLGIVGRRRRAP